MADFFMISTRSTKREAIEIYPKFIVGKSLDLMIRGGDFYAVWLEELGLWSTDEQDAINLIDQELDRFAEQNKSKFFDTNVRVMHLWDSETGMIDTWHKYCQKQMRDSFHMLDEKLIFSNTETKKRDYASKRLNYPLEEGPMPAYDRLMSVLYSEEERRKIEWAIGSVVSGASKKLQKFLVLYGAAGTGKSTVLNIIQQLFDGYYSVFDAKALGSSSNSFALEAFKKNPLVAIQHDGDLSRIEDNTRLNSLVSHELMTINEKFKSTYENRFKCLLFMGTNKPVKITDGKSGILRRLIDVSPTGNKLDPKEYKTIMKQISFELGAIAYHCQEVYLSDTHYYDDYVPVTMFGASNDFYNFVLDSYRVFKKDDSTTLRAAWEMYQTYCDWAKVAYPFSERVFKEELKNYFREFSDKFDADDGSVIRGYYSGFKTEQFEIKPRKKKEKEPANLIQFDSEESIFDIECADCPAQYATAKETPYKKWENVTTKLSDLDTTKLHYVMVPENHIVIDFDIKDSEGNKCFEKNVEEASKWPATYAELSKSGGGIHLHYIYAGDVTKLSRIYDDNIEVKVFTGNQSLRRRFTKCNSLPVATISSGLPLKGDKMINKEVVKSEKGIRTLIKKNLNKECHPGTKPSVDFIYKILDDAYNTGMKYDVSDMKNAIVTFAAGSTNHSDYCLKLVNKMHFKSEDPSLPDSNDDEAIVFYDVEVFPNLFLVNWKFEGPDQQVVRMINPTSKDIEGLLNFRLVGFNCRRYDNHMLYARLMGYTNEQLYKLSQRIINSAKGDRNAGLFGEAFNVSYTDIYDYASKKQSLKKWEIELGIHHQELGLPWDQPVPEELWEKVAEYCDADVKATEAVWNATQDDFIAREILADIAGGTVNDTTNSLTTKIIFGNEKNPELVYTDLATGESTDGTKNKANAFPGYEFKPIDDTNIPHNMYRGVDLGLGGYVYSEPGMYVNVALLDIQSLHPASAIAMNCFGKYTKNFKDIRDMRVLIKHKEFDKAKELFGGRLAKYFDDTNKAKTLAQALKIAINSVYGLTSANFQNPFRDNRNKNNIVALRGALFMKTLQDEVVKRGFQVVHIKTDSIKIANATQEIIDFCMEFASKYGYVFEHEATYDRICLVNNAVYIAKYADSAEWTATGTQFQVPYVFKKLFSKEQIEFADLCEAKEVKTAIYLDSNEGLPEGEHNRRFIGKVGLFCPIKKGCGGAELVREGKDKAGNVKYDSVTGAKGYRWMEAEMVKSLGKEKDIDLTYYNALVDDAVESISKYGDFEWFVSGDPMPVSEPLKEPPWIMDCGKYSCTGCPHLLVKNETMTCKQGYDISDLKILNNKR